MTLIAIALFGLLFVAVFGAKATQAILKGAGVILGLGAALIVVAILTSATQPRATASYSGYRGAPPGYHINFYGRYVDDQGNPPPIRTAAQQCEEWRAAVRPCGIPYRDANGTGTLPLTCRAPDARDLPSARTLYAGFQGIHDMDDQQAIAWLMQVQKTFSDLAAASNTVQPAPQACAATRS